MANKIKPSSTGPAIGGIGAKGAGKKGPSFPVKPAAGGKSPKIAKGGGKSPIKVSGFPAGGFKPTKGY